MNLISFRHKGNLNKTEIFCKRTLNPNYMSIIERYGREGVNALSSATPINSGETASSWGYKIKRNKYSVSIIWTNSHVENGIPIVILIQYGHATSNGGYVQGHDFINPALKPVFDKMAKEVWEEVIR